VFAAGDYGKIVIWDAATGELARTLEPQIKGTPLYAAAISPKGNVLATGIGRHLWESGPDLWDLGSGAPLGGFGTGLTKGLSVAFTPDGSRLAAAADNGAAVWDTIAGRHIRTFADHDKEVAAVAISRDGRLVLTGGRDNRVKLWDVAAGSLLRTFEGHRNWVDRVALSPDGRQTASGDSLDGQVNVWDLVSGQRLHNLRGHVASITALACRPTGERSCWGAGMAR
jgi:WD40 repeat protein